MLSASLVQQFGSDSRTSVDQLTTDGHRHTQGECDKKLETQPECSRLDAPDRPS